MLKLGDFVFDVDDYPEELPLGGSSLVTIEKYPGGIKSIQNFGAFDEPISLSGTFLYTSALDKARSVDTMWRAGQPVQLIVDNLTPRWVLITALKLKYRNEFDVPYEITLERVSSDDLNEILYGSSEATSGTSQTTVMSGSPQQPYTVQAGDTLWKIAANQYGDGSQYTKIADANNIKDPSSIQPGQQLVIPT